MIGGGSDGRVELGFRSIGEMWIRDFDGWRVLGFGFGFGFGSVCILFVIRVCVCIDVIIYVVYSLIFSFLFSRPQVSIRRLERQKRRELKGQERSSLSERLFVVFVYYGILFYFYS